MFLLKLVQKTWSSITPKVAKNFDSKLSVSDDVVEKASTKVPPASSDEIINEVSKLFSKEHNDLIESSNQALRNADSLYRDVLVKNSNSIDSSSINKLDEAERLIKSSNLLSDTKSKSISILQEQKTLFANQFHNKTNRNASDLTSPNSLFGNRESLDYIHEFNVKNFIKANNMENLPKDKMISVLQNYFPYKKISSPTSNNRLVYDIHYNDDVISRVRYKQEIASELGIDESLVYKLSPYGDRLANVIEKALDWTN